MMLRPVQWSKKQLSADVVASEKLFRDARLVASQAWTIHYQAARKNFEALFKVLGELPPGQDLAVTIVQAYQAKLGDALRYLAGPPISHDDLKKLADVKSIAPSSLTKDEAALRRVVDVIEQSLDPHRFPWREQGHPPTASQTEAALLSSSVLMAAQTMATARRNDAKKEQEDMVKKYLTSLGMQEVPPAKIGTIVHGPHEMEFCGEAMLGTRKADVIVRLHDTRLLAIECKVSNSALNSPP